jgi:hypothetical protein
MHLGTKKNNNYLLIMGAATVCLLATTIMAASSIAAPAAIATITGSNATTNRTTSSSSRLGLLPQPIYQERSILESQTQINQTHIQITFLGNGTLDLPNSTDAIKTTSVGSGISSLIDGTFAGRLVLTTQDGRENATATTYEIGQFNLQDITGRGIAIAIFHTNSTGKLAPLDGMILAGQDEFLPEGSAFITYWEWKSEGTTT